MTQKQPWVTHGWDPGRRASGRFSTADPASGWCLAVHGSPGTDTPQMNIMLSAVHTAYYKT